MEDFSIRYNPQKVWGLPHVAEFFFIGVGAGLFIAGGFFGAGMLPMLMGWLMAAVGGLILISDLGRPNRFSKAASNWRSSWVARGAVSFITFIITGAIYIAPDFFNTLSPGAVVLTAPWTALRDAIGVIAALAGLVMLIYPGLVLAQSPSIPFWNTTLIPLQFLATAFAGALGILLPMKHLGVVSSLGVGVKTLESYQVLVLLFGLALVLAHLGNAYYSRGAARESVHAVTRGSLAPHYIGGVLVAGLIAPLLLTAAAYYTGGSAEFAALTSSGVLILAGVFLLRYSVLKAGIFPPVY